MAKKVIILTKKNEGTYFTVNYLYWLDVPAAQQFLYANPNFVSSYASATSDEVSSLRAGQVYELVGNTTFNNGTSAATVKSALQNGWASIQTDINNQTQWQFYGSYWDGTTWTNQGV